MARQDYIPKREDEMISWFANLAAKLPGYQVALGLTALEVAGVVSDSLVVQFSIQGVEQARAEAQEWVAFKNLELYGPAAGPTPTVPSTPAPAPISARPPGILIRTRALAMRIKASPAYTPAMGADLGLIGAESAPPDLEETKPSGSVVALPGFTVRINFIKSGFAGVDIESQRNAETGWSYLAFDSASPYIDNRPPLSPPTPGSPAMPEERRYRMRYRDGDSPVGMYSDTLTVTVGS